MAQSKALGNVFILDSIVNLKDPRFGAKGDYVSGTGVGTDDTAAIVAAMAALPANGGEIVIPPGDYLFSSTITVSKRIRFRGLGVGGLLWSSGADQAGSIRFWKKATLNAAGFILSSTAQRASLENMTIIGVAGNGGDGVVLNGVGQLLRQVGTMGMGQHGIRIGLDASGGNSNLWLLDNCSSFFNGSHGLYIHDGGVGRDANAGTAINYTGNSNGSDGLRIEKASHNTFIGTVCETNIGSGLRLTALSQNNYFYGGDVSESNGGNDLQLDSTSADNFIMGMSIGTRWSDSGSRNIIDCPAETGAGAFKRYEKLQVSRDKTKVDKYFNFVDADVSVGADTITEVGHGFPTGQSCRLTTTTGTLPAGLALATTYWIIRVDADTIQLATTYANAAALTAINITGAAGGGTHTLSIYSGIMYGLESRNNDQATEKSSCGVLLTNDPSSLGNAALVAERTISGGKGPVHLLVKSAADGALPGFGDIKMSWTPDGALQGLQTTNGPCGTFTCANNANTVVNNTSVTSASLIYIMPTNSAAGTLMGAATCLYVSARTNSTSFTVTTANAAAAAGTETFNYWIVN